MPEFYNPNPFTVHLTDPNGKIIKVPSKRRITLSNYFDKYRERGLLALVTAGKEEVPTKRYQSKLVINKRIKPKQSAQPTPPPTQAPSLSKRRKQIILANRKQQIVRSRVVGRSVPVTTNKLFDQCNNPIYPISNNIGVGILSYNRLDSLKRLLDSIVRYTDLRRTTIFVSDDGSTDNNLIKYLSDLEKSGKFVIIRNQSRIGIAGNSNRLLQCLSRFKYGILLNDDVEIINTGWESLYPNLMERANLHHMVYREPGVYGAQIGNIITRLGVNLRVVHDKPQGAVLAFTNDMLRSVGFFDENYGLYGMEHVDWSTKPSDFDLQPAGFYDSENSHEYFILHSEKSAVENRSELLKESRAKFANRTVQICGFSQQALLPNVSYVVPFRNIDRSDSILSVIGNIKAQRFPVINIFMSEHDSETKINLSPFHPVQYSLSQDINAPFNKSKAFNLALSNVVDDLVILHDADMLASALYTSDMYKILQSHDCCHIGKRVFYATADMTKKINTTGIVDETTIYDRVVGYFEGGSLGMRRDTYWKIGGFNEDYRGYGCEDCDFYARLSSTPSWHENRYVDFLHLWHPRTENWTNYHNNNKLLEAKLSKMPMEQRIELQRNQLLNNGYGAHL